MTFVFDDTVAVNRSWISVHRESANEPTGDNIEFDEDLYLYKAQMYDSDMNQEYERYIVAIDFEGATAIAKAYFEDKCVSVTGIWQVDIVIGRYYE